MPLGISLKYIANLKEINQILDTTWEYFVAFMGVEIIKPSNANGNSLKLTKQLEYNIFWKEQKAKPSLWILVVSIIGGILVLALIVAILYRVWDLKEWSYFLNSINCFCLQIGFFKRAKKEEMDRLIHRASVRAAAKELPPTESLPLNDDNNANWYVNCKIL